MQKMPWTQTCRFEKDEHVLGAILTMSQNECALIRMSKKQNVWAHFKQFWPQMFHVDNVL